ncbi:hypothetical protein AGMMS49938_02680 [Fibrobacterales bacterium]|nr:hypothetical protein AGMMS49938_02680 [Fibrobacterales bacterium]
MFDRTAFFGGTFAEAEQRAIGNSMSLEERLDWNIRSVRAAYGYDPDKPIPMDRTAFSARKITEV